MEWRETHGPKIQHLLSRPPTLSLVLSAYRSLQCCPEARGPRPNQIRRRCLKPIVHIASPVRQSNRVARARELVASRCAVCPQVVGSCAKVRVLW